MAIYQRKTAIACPASAHRRIPEFDMVDKTGMWIAGGNEAETDVSEAPSD
jgi:hypothetical protein